MKKFAKLGIMMGLMAGMLVPGQSVFAQQIEIIDVANNNISLRVIVDELAQIEKDGTLNDIIIQERFAGELTQSKYMDERTIVLSLEGTKYTFKSLPTVTLSNGFKDLPKAKVDYISQKGVEDNKMISITLPKSTDVNSKGQLTISNLKVATTSNVKDENLSIGVGMLIDETYTDIKVAQILSYGATLEVDRVYELQAGDSHKVSFKINEGMADSMVADRAIDISVDRGFFKADKDGELLVDAIYLNGKNIISKVELSTHEDENGKITDFTMRIPELDDSKRDEIEVVGLELFADLDDSGDVQLTVSSRDFEKDLKEDIATIDTNTNIHIEKVAATYDQKKQVGGAIIIEEESKRTLGAGTIKIELEGRPYIEYTNVPKVEVTEGNLKVGDIYWEDDYVLVLEVIKKSTVPSTLKISNFKFNVDDTCPDGKFGVTVYGTSIAPEVESSKVVFDDFITVSEKSSSTDNGNGNNINNNVNNNTNNNTNNNQNVNNGNQNGSAGKLVTTFTLGSNSYVCNGISYQMEAAAFSKGGRTMVPVRYVAKAAGISENDIKYKNGVITVVADQVITLRLGSNILTKGNETIKMETTPAVVGSRTYVPVAEIARALGMQVVWDSSTQTATFTK